MVGVRGGLLCPKDLKDVSICELVIPRGAGVTWHQPAFCLA